MELSPGVTEEEFERFLKEEWSSFVHPAGRTGGWFKGVKGEREGKYLSYIEIEDYEAVRERFFTSDGEANEEYNQHGEAYPKNAELFEKFKTLSVGWGESFTEYVDTEINYLKTVE
jgi:hypothetical protein